MQANGLFVDFVSKRKTGKANNLKPYEYFEYLLTELPEYIRKTKRL